MWITRILILSVAVRFFFKEKGANRRVNEVAIYSSEYLLVLSLMICSAPYYVFTSFNYHVNSMR
jgi:hypothetical protein